MEEKTQNKASQITGDGNLVGEKIEAQNINIDHSQNKKTAGDHSIVADSLKAGGDITMGDKIVNQHFHGNQTLKEEEVADALWKSSHHFYKWIRSEDGRFEGLKIHTNLLAKGKTNASAKAYELASAQKKAAKEATTNQEQAKADALAAMNKIRSIANTEPSANDASFLQKWWQQGHPHALLQAEEGMGKTVSMLKLWEAFLNPEGPHRTIPIYIPLSQYNRVSGKAQEKFILQYIAQYYLRVPVLENDLETVLVKWLKEETPADQPPKLILLLDGLNEITSDITPFLIDLSEEWVDTASECGIQILVSSRYASNHQFSQGFNIWSLQPLETEVIKDFLGDQFKGDQGPQRSDDTLNELLTTPMMLSLYANIKEEPAQVVDSDLKPEIHSVGELLWNFVEQKLARFEAGNGHDPVKCTRHHFLVQYLLPFFAFQMEKEESLDIQVTDLENVVKDAFKRFQEPSFFAALKGYRKHIKRYRKHILSLQIGELPVMEEISRFEKLMDDFKHELFPVTWERDLLRFFHQSFMDFFAAKHVLNEIRFSLEQKEIPPILKESILPSHIRKMLGEIIGEHYNQPAFFPEGLAWNEAYQETDLAKVLDLCRGIFEPEKLGYVVWNILSIFKEVRGELSGTDFSHLHLGVFNFNGISCAQLTPDGKLVKCNWDNSRLSPKQWFPQGHRSHVTKVRIGPDGKYLASASSDHTIKLWMTGTNHFVRTLHDKHGHNNAIHALAFSPDNQCILSGGADKKVMEWSITTGQCLQVYRGHAATVRDVDYHPLERKLLSASEDGTVWEWSRESGKCLQTYNFSKYGKLHTVFYIKNGRSILVGTERGPIIEMSTSRGGQEISFGPIGVRAMACSSCGERIATLSTSPEAGTLQVEEWMLHTRVRNKVFTFEAPSAQRRILDFCDIAYSSCGQYILVAGLDDNIYEWSVKDQFDRESNDVTQVFKGHVRGTTSIAYHPNGKQLYSGANDATIKNWSTSTGQATHTFQPRLTPFNDISDLPDSPWLVAGSEDGTIHRWSLIEGSLMRDKIFKGDAPAYSMAYYVSPEKNQSRLINGGEWGIIQVWSMDGQCVRLFNGHKVTVSSLTLDQESKLILSADIEGNLILWSLEDESFVIHYPQQTQAITHVAFSPIPGDLHFVTSDRQGNIKMWLAKEESLEPIGQTFEHGSRVYTIDFDGKHILSGGFDGKVKEFNVEQKTENLLWETPNNSPIIFTAYNPDYQRILVCMYKSNVLYELPINEAKNRSINIDTIKQFKGHENYILAAKYGISSAHTILTVSQDATLKEWNTETGECNWTIENIPGLWVADMDFREVRWTEPLTDEEWDLLELYGATLVDKAPY